MTAPLPVLGLARDAFATVSEHLPQLLRLGLAPFVVAVVVSVVLGALEPGGATPVASLVAALAYAWFSFYVFRLVLLGPSRALLPKSERQSGEGPLIRTSSLGTYMGRAVGLGVLGVAGVVVVLLVVVVPLTVLPLPAAEQQAMLQRPGYAVTANLVLATVLAAWPVGVPLARLLPVLPATAIEHETRLGAAWRLSRGHGLRLAAALILIAAPFVLGYAALNTTLQMLADATGSDGAGPVAHVVTLALVTAIGLTVTALGSVAIARAWCVMTGVAAAVPSSIPPPVSGTIRE